jgi:entericidin ecnAB
MRPRRTPCAISKKRYNKQASTVEVTIKETPMNKTTKKLTQTAALLAFAGLLVACNTVQGFGRDVERAGQKVSTAAERAK